MKPEIGQISKVPELSLVIPVYCEADHLEASLSEIREVVVGLDVSHEMILVDDGSTDKTWETLQRLAEEWSELSAVKLARNFGKEAALAAGLEESRGDAVIVLDCDLQHPPELIPELYSLWRSDGYQVVSAVKKNRGDETLAQGLAARLFYKVYNRLSGEDLRGSSDFKLLDRSVVDAYRNLPERSLFFRGIVSWMGFRHVEVPFTVRERTSGESKWSRLRLLRFALNTIASFSAIPLQLVTFAGAIFLMFSLALGVQTLYVKLSGGAVAGFTTVILLLLIASSILMVALGIIGQYLAKIYDEVKGRPRYLVTESLNLERPAERAISEAIDRYQTR